MRLSDLSVRRPVLATVANLLIVVFGLAALQNLPVRELPNIDAAIVTVTTTYSGASPEVVDTDITEIIESAVAGISGIKSISSQSRRGRSRTVIEFQTGRDIESAANDVRSAVARVRGRLPDEVEEPQVVKNDDDSDPVMRIAVISSMMTPSEITDYIERSLSDRLSTLDGVASIQINGERRAAIRIWLDRRALAARDIAVSDIETALQRNNVELPAGEVESVQRQLSVRLDSRLASVEDFRNVVIRRDGEYPIRLGDVARVELGVEDDSTIVRSDGKLAVGISVLRQSQANTVAISEAVTAELERIRPILPEGMEIVIGSDEAEFISASIHEVLMALVEALVLVVVVILLFLSSLRATLVPAVTIPVALIGSFSAIALLGFSINILTLLALLLAIGLVVDDAIVVLENISRRMSLGERPLLASLLGTRQVTFAVLATSATLMAVFVPLSFLQGEAGRLFVEFGFVMASAVAISTFVALTLCPVIASKVLKPSDKLSGDESVESGGMGWLGKGYRKALGWSLNAPLVILTGASAFAGLGYILYESLPQELTPREDRAALFIPITTPQGSTTTYTNGQVTRVENGMGKLRQNGELASTFAVVGMQNQPNRGFVVLRLSRWEERDRELSAIIRDVIPVTASLVGARGFPVAPAGLGLRGSNSPLRVVVGGSNFEDVKVWAQQLKQLAEANDKLRNVELDYEENEPQLSLSVDRRRADDLGISVQSVASTLQVMLASKTVTTYIDRGREYDVVMQARDEDRRIPSDIDNIFVRASTSGALVPLMSLVSSKEQAGAPELRRFDRLPSITLSAALEEGYDLGSAIRYMQEVTARDLPPEARIAFDGQSRQYLEASSGVMVTFALALLIVFLVLAAQFESFVHPIVIMLSVPLATTGALLSLAVAGLSLNLYSQIGIILLIGLMAKNGILIVEFANQLRDEGKSVREAVLEASVLRLRPILMTVISTILGAVPLMLASGAGAESRIAIGIVIVGGLGIASIMTLFLTPVLYDLMARFTKPRGTIEKMLEEELGAIDHPRSHAAE